MDFPTLVYKNGGVHQRKGGTFSFIEVSDEAEYDDKLADGWVSSMPELDVVAAPETVNADDGKPTRAELETKATELGIKFDARLGDKKLSALIEKALA